MDIDTNKSVLGETWNYFKVRKTWWLLPPVILIILVGVFIIAFGSNSALSPFIYALF